MCHNYCIEQYAEVKGLDINRACPIRCHGRPAVDIDDEAELPSATPVIEGDLEELLNRAMTDAANI